MAVRQPGEYRPPVSWFTAQFDSECDTCGGDIYEGDEAGYLPGANRASCQDCIEEHEEG